MNRFLSSFLLGYLLLLFYHGSESILFIQNGLSLWFEKLVPSLFLPMVLLKLLYVRQVFHHVSFPFVCSYFHINKETIPLLINTILLGFPLGSISIKEAYDRKQLQEKEAKRLLYTCCFASPSFILITCGVVCFHSITIGILLFISQLCSGLLLFRCTKSCQIEALPNTYPITSFPKQLATIMTESGLTLFLIGGYLLFFLTLTNLLSSLLPSFCVPILTLLSEFSTGIFYVTSLPYNPLLQQLLICFILSFAGFCVHMQIFSSVFPIKMSYPKFLCFRIAQGLISCIFYLCLHHLLL